MSKSKIFNLIKSQNLRNLKNYFLVSLLSIAIFLCYFCKFKFKLTIPLMYQGDCVSVMAIIKALAQGDWWPYSVIRSNSLGAPFGLTIGDFPVTETLQFIILKALSVFTKNPVILYNLYYLLTFPLTAITSLYVFKKLRFSPLISIFLAICFSFLPFHLRRYSHLFLSAIFLIPLMSLVLIRLWGKKPTLFIRNVKSEFSFDMSHSQARFAFVIAFLSGAYGIYYTVFFSFFLLIGGISSALYRKSYPHFISAILLLITTLSSTGLSALPYIIYQVENGHNHRAISRNRSDAERYALKLTYLLLPQENHTIKAFSKYRGKYVPTSPKTEGFNESIGIFGSIGFIILLIRFLNPFYQTIYDRLKILTFSAVLLSTAGGLGTILALVFSALIRSYNRISVFISFFCLLALGAKLNSLTFRVSSRTMGSEHGFTKIRELSNAEFPWNHAKTKTRFLKVTFFKRLIFPMTFLLCMFVAIIDQVTDEFSAEQKMIESQFLSDLNFVQMIEKTLPNQAMVLQLPFIEFPENGPVFQMEDYSHFRAFIHSKTSKWSYPLMRGRPNAEKMREYSQMPLNLETIRSLGFRGIFIDRFGFKDHGIEIENYLRGILKSEPMVSQDQRNLFFKI